MNARLNKFLACPHHNIQTYTECCMDCGENIYTTAEEILEKEGMSKVKVDTVNMTEKFNPYNKAKGFWKVTTEGDCEGRTTHDLGIHFGFIDDIAFSLADKAYYALTFKAIEPYTAKAPKATKVNVVLDIDSGTWDMKSETRQAFVEQMLQGRDTAVAKGQFYASVELVMGKNELLQKEREKEILRQQALSKLSEADRKILGL